MIIAKKVSFPINPLCGTRHYGYSLYDTEGSNQYRDRHNFGWYKYKSDAIKRAKELNNSKKRG